MSEKPLGYEAWDISNPHPILVFGEKKASVLRRHELFTVALEMGESLRFC